MHTFIRLISAFFLSTLFLSCSSTKQTTDEQAGAVNYSLVYVIHADANYTYHVSGDRRQADLDALNRAMNTGKKAKHGEVFIFHQKPEKKVLFLFPKKDRLFYHYRNGTLVHGESYSPKEGGLQSEAEFFRQHRTALNTRKFFLYFGHEIPSGTPNFAYHQSQPHLQFNTEVFSTDLSLFSDHFELAVLSTCNNGNPLMAEALTGRADYLVASPQNLHLSHLIDEPFLQLESNPSIPAKEIANNVAKNSYERLSAFLHTMVTVAVYDLNEISTYITSFASAYENYLNNINQHSLFVDNMDCRSLSAIEKPLPSNGINLYFKPAAFGRQTSEHEHSGWGCRSN